MYHQEIVENKIVNQMQEIMPYIKNKTGYEAGEIVYEYFCNTKHPHPTYTFEQEALNRDMSLDTTNYFAKELARKMAYLVAENEMLVEYEKKQPPQTL